MGFDDEHLRRDGWRRGWAAGMIRAAEECETRARRHLESIGGSSIDGLHGAMADAYEGLARRLRTLPMPEPPATDESMGAEKRKGPTDG